MPKTIKEILIDVVHGAVGGDSLPLTSNENKAVDTALAEISQLLKECKPAQFTSHLDSRLRGKTAKINSHSEGILTDREERIYGYGGNDTVAEYTANIEKRLG